MCVDCVLASPRIARADPGRWIPPWGSFVTEGNAFGARVFESDRGHRECDSPERFYSFPAKTIEGLRRLSKLLSVKTHSVDGC
jgi:hypothetical protein